MSNTDRPLKSMLSADLRILSSSLQSAISDAKFCGLHSLAEKLEHLRQPIVDEYNSPARAAAESGRITRHNWKG